MSETLNPTNFMIEPIFFEDYIKSPKKKNHITPINFFFAL